MLRYEILNGSSLSTVEYIRRYCDTIRDKSKKFEGKFEYLSDVIQRCNSDIIKLHNTTDEELLTTELGCYNKEIDDTNKYITSLTDGYYRLTLILIDLNFMLLQNPELNDVLCKIIGDIESDARGILIDIECSDENIEFYTRKISNISAPELRQKELDYLSDELNNLTETL